MSQQESINSFCNHFQEQFNQIVLIDNRRHQKILLVTAIDDISRAYREGGTNLPYDTWELVYPVNFFISLTKSSLHNLKEHLSEKDIDP